MAYVSFLRRVAAPLLMSTALVACTPSARFDDSTFVGSVEPVQNVAQPLPPSGVEQQANYTANPRPVSSVDTFEAGDPASAPSVESAPLQANAAAAPRRLPKIDSDEALAANDGIDTSMGVQPLRAPEGGVNMDSQLGVAPKRQQQPVVGLAEEQANQIAEGETDQPVVDGIGTDAPTVVSQPAGRSRLPQSDMGEELDTQSQWKPQASNRQGRRTAPVADEGGEQVAFLARPDNPAIERQTPGVMPASERACRAELKRMGVVFQDISPISQGPTCGIPYPIQVSGLSGGSIGVRPATKLNCQVTLAFAKWVKNELQPSARMRYWSGIKTIVPLGGYSCRRMNSSARNPWSEHAHGNAIDVGKFVLNNGKKIDVRKPGFFAFREKALLKAVRSDSCKYFNTVLGPGSDPHHKDHFHFDLRERRSGYRHCD